MKLSQYLLSVVCFLLVAAKRKTGERQLSSLGIGYSVQDPTDPSFREVLQLAIESVDENWSPAPNFYYSPIERVEEVESSVIQGEGAWYNMIYSTPNGWVFNGNQCDISFTVWATENVPTYKDVTVSSLQCVSIT